MSASRVNHDPTYTEVQSRKAVHAPNRISDFPYMRIPSGMIPAADAVYDLGGATRWRKIVAKNTSFGDLGLIERICPECDLEFEVGEMLTMVVTAVQEEPPRTDMVPVHLACAIATLP